MVLDVQMEEHASVAEMPKQVRNYVQQRMHGIAGWTQGSINFKRWKVAAEAIMQQVREEAEEHEA